VGILSRLYLTNFSIALLYPSRKYYNILNRLFHSILTNSLFNRVLSHGLKVTMEGGILIVKIKKARDEIIIFN
jgi:hypothetical protein